MKQPSLKKNTIIYGFRNLVNVLIPLITFPYLCQVLSVDGLGKVNFATSVSSYFSLFAGLGIFTYGKVKGAKIREDRQAFNQFASELFSLNLLTTIAAFLLFLVFLSFSRKMESYAGLLLIFSAGMWITLLGQEWILDVYEEYTFIAACSIAMQLLAVFFLFGFIRSDGDLILYPIYSLIITAAANLLYCFRLSRLVKIRLVFSKGLLVHLSPILILFANALSTNIYLFSDITVLGYLTTDAEVGYYNAAVKISSIIKMTLASITTVSGTRMAYLYVRSDRTEYYRTFRNLFYTLLMVAIPATVGLFLLRIPIVTMVADAKYIYSADILVILLPNLLAGLIEGFLFGSYVLVVDKAKIMLYATTSGAVLNVALNLLLIPRYGARAAAFTTVLSEGVVLWILIVTAVKDRRLFDYPQLARHTGQFVLAAVLMAVLCSRLKALIASDLLQIALVSVVGVVVYFGTLLLMGNSLVKEELRTLLRKMKKA